MLGIYKVVNRAVARMARSPSQESGYKHVNPNLANKLHLAQRQGCHPVLRIGVIAVAEAESTNLLHIASRDAE